MLNAIAFVQGNSGATASATTSLTSATASWTTQDTTLGNFLFAVWGFDINPGTITPPAGWVSTQRGTTQSNGTASYLAVFANVNAAVQTHGVNQTWNWVNAVNANGWSYGEYSGVAQSSPFDTGGSDAYHTGNTAVNITGGAFSTNNANDLILSPCCISAVLSSGITISSSSPYTLREHGAAHNASNPISIAVGLSDQIVSSTGTYTGTTGSATAQPWIGGTLAVMAVGGSGRPNFLTLLGVS